MIVNDKLSLAAQVGIAGQYQMSNNDATKLYFI